MFKAGLDVDDDIDLADNGQDMILAIVSRENERVDLNKTVTPSLSKGNVEQWLLELETIMKSSVKQVIDTSNMTIWQLEAIKGKTGFKSGKAKLFWPSLKLNGQGRLNLLWTIQIL